MFATLFYGVKINHRIQYSCFETKKTDIFCKLIPHRTLKTYLLLNFRYKFVLFISNYAFMNFSQSPKEYFVKSSKLILSHFCELYYEIQTMYF